MPMIAKQARYTLFIVDDNDPLNPREDRDNFGKMVCFHRRYALGDKHDYKDPDDFLADLCRDTFPASEIVKMIADNKLEYLRFEPDEEEIGTYYLKYYDDYFKKWYEEATFDYPPAEAEDEIADAALECMKTSDLLELARNNNVILPLYLYDHSGITMSCSPFSCRWDSGQVGWIYADSDMIKKEYGAVTPETIAKAKSLLESEVKEYDYYITGQCYGYKLYEGDNQIDSCWGFIGEINDVSKNIKEHLPSECANIVDSLEFHYDVDEDEYLEQSLEDENEMEM